MTCHSRRPIKQEHIYANPYAPHICPILALGMYVFSFGFRVEGEDQSKLFLGSTYENYTKWLGEALECMGHENASVESEDYGTYSFRKGAASYYYDIINKLKIY